MADHEENDSLQVAIWVMRAQLGNVAACSKLFEHFQPGLVLYLRKVIGMHPDIEDIAQEAWITVIRKIPTLKQPARFKPWLFRVAHNQAISKLRRGKRELLLDTPSLAQIVDEMSGGPMPDDASERERRAEEISAVVRGLSRKHQEVLNMHYHAGLTYEEIAEILNCRIGTVRSRIHYAKERIRVNLNRNSFFQE